MQDGNFSAPNLKNSDPSIKETKHGVTRPHHIINVAINSQLISLVNINGQSTLRGHIIHIFLFVSLLDKILIKDFVWEKA